VCFDQGDEAWESFGEVFNGSDSHARKDMGQGLKGRLKLGAGWTSEVTGALGGMLCGTKDCPEVCVVVLSILVIGVD